MDCVIPSPFIKVNIAKTDVKCGLADYSLSLGFLGWGFIFSLLSLCCVPEEQKSAFFQQGENCSVSKLPPARLVWMLQDTELRGTIMPLQKQAT